MSNNVLLTALIAVQVFVIIFVYTAYKSQNQSFQAHLQISAQQEQRNNLKDHLLERDYAFELNPDARIETLLGNQQASPSSPSGNEKAYKVRESKDYKNLTALKADAQEATLKYNKSVDEIRSKLEMMNIFRDFDVYKVPNRSHHNGYPRARPLYKSNYMGFVKNPGYCDEVDMYNLHNPDNVFKQKNFIVDYIQKSLVRKKVVHKIGNDVNPFNSMGMKGKRKPRYEMNITAGIMFTKKVNVHQYFEIGRQFGCLSQMYGHLPGNGILTRKDLNVAMVNTYAQKYPGKNNKCFNYKKYYPYSFRLNNKTECLDFFEEINSPEYEQIKKKEPIPFILKKGYNAHRARGLAIMNKEKEAKVREKYDNGKKCGEISHPTVAQKYISDPLLLDFDNKFDFRIYMLIASVDPLIVYYHDGFLRVSLNKYDKNSNDTSVHFTNTHLSKALFRKAAEEGTFNGMNETELRNYQMWTMQRLADYLKDKGRVDSDWLDKDLRPKFKKAFIHTARMVRPFVVNSPSVFEMFGLDFLLDNDLNLWFIECNASPQLIGTSDYKTDFLVTMLTDMFEIEYALIRSRWARMTKVAKQYMNEMLTKGKVKNMDTWKEKMKKAARNKIDEAYQPPANSSWSLIVDENLPGNKAYMGHIEEECLVD